MTKDISPLSFQEEDPFSPIRYGYTLQGILYSARSQYADIKVAEHAYFGRMLILDGVVQLTERDEYFYHEMLSHVPLHAHPLPVDVLIVGGGDGGTLREVLKHQEVRRAVVAEIDREVIEVSKKFLPALSTGFAEPRASVVIGDGADFVAGHQGEFDVILVDSTDPVGPAESLFSEQFFRDAFSALKPEGMLVAQTESLHFHLDFVRQVQRRLAGVFQMVDLYTVPLATYAGNWWSFSIASKRHNPRKITRQCQVSTRYYAPDVHRHSFLPRSLRRRLLKG